MRPVSSAFTIAGLLSAYLIGGTVYNNYSQNDLSERAKPLEKPFLVQIASIKSQHYIQKIIVSGHSEAIKKVIVKAEVEGRVIETPFKPGTFVNKGDVLCRLEPNERIATLDESRAFLIQRQLEYTQSKNLAAKGHRSKTQLAGAKAQLDAALANVERRKLDLNNTYIKAPYAGIMNSREAEVGAFLSKGSGCAVLVQQTPILAVGEVSEDIVSMVKVGKTAYANIKGLREVTGTIRTISSVANENTRAFRIEVKLDNEEGLIRDGLTTKISIPLKSSQAHFIPSSSLILGGKGTLGIRAVIDGKVLFMPITILEDEIDGIWVAGLPQNLTLITVGQDFVSDGQTVRTIEKKS